MSRKMTCREQLWSSRPGISGQANNNRTSSGSRLLIQFHLILKEVGLCWYLVGAKGLVRGFSEFSGSGPI